MTCGIPVDLAVGGLRLRLHSWGGDGPPVLLLHSQAAHGHWWDWAAPLLADHCAVMALDFRGHGGSGWADPPAYDFADHARDVAGVLDTLGWRRPIAVGHSLGGYVAALLAAQDPERLGALVIADSLVQWSDGHEQWRRRQLERPPARFETRGAAATRFKLSPPPAPAPAAWARHLGAEGVVERAGVWEHAFDRHVFEHGPVDAWAFLPRVTCPTLTVRGEASPVMDRDTSLRVATTVRRGQFAEVAGAGHHLIVDDPAAFVSTVLDWVARLDLGLR